MPLSPVSGGSSCRHGHVAREAADLQENAFYGGNFDAPLSAGGDADMRAVAEYIGSQHYSEAAATVFASPTAAVSGSLLQRALAPRVVGGVRLVQSDLLAEVDRGRWANLTAAEVRRRWGDDSYERWALDDDYGARECGGEGMGDLRARALAVRDLVLERTLPGTASVICTHLWVRARSWPTPSASRTANPSTCRTRRSRCLISPTRRGPRRAPTATCPTCGCSAACRPTPPATRWGMHRKGR